MRHYIFICSLLLAVALPANVSAAVNILINDTRYEYTQPVRLDQVLAPVAAQSRWYWPASALFDVNQQDAIALKYTVLAQIEALSADYHNDSEFLAGLNSLREQVKSWTISHRVRIPIDYDAIRLNVSLNREMLAGSYRLILTTRPQKVQVISAFGAYREALYKPQRTAADYAEQFALHSQLDKDWAYVISPDGFVRKIGIAYWNKEAIQIMPGSQIYFPLNTSILNSDIEALNRNIAKLAANRVVEW